MAITLNTKVYNWANWTPTGLSRYFNAGTTPAAAGNLTFGSKASSKQISDSCTLSLPVLAASDSSCACEGEVLRNQFLTIKHDTSPMTTLTERTDMYLRLKDLVLTAQFEAWFKYGTLPVT